MPKLTQMRSVPAVNDLQASVAFHCDRMGFEIDLETEGRCFVSRDNFILMLGHCPDEVPASQINDHSYFAYIEVDDIDALHQDFVAR